MLKGLSKAIKAQRFHVKQAQNIQILDGWLQIYIDA